ncbi:MAG: hypothetical protein IJB57_10725 [Clostridia bacterium]|nr:hypothetical protein [Clostridia bacterium]
MNTNIKFAKTAKFLSVFGFILILSPFLYAFMGAGENEIFDLLFAFAGPVLFISLGYLLQALVGRVTRYKRKDIRFDGGVKYIDLPACILPVVLCVLTVIPMIMLYRGYRISIDHFIDAYALYIYIPPIIAAAMMILGVVLWFLPYNKLIYTESVYGYGALYLICFIISVIFGVSLIPVTVYFALFIGIFFTVSNLGCIDESLSASKFRVPSNNFRSYNLKLTLKHYALTLIAATLIFCMIVLALGVIHPDIALDPHDATQEEDRLITDEAMPADGVTMGEFWAKLFSVKDAEGMSGIMKVSMFVVVGAFLVLVLWWIYRKHLLKKFFYLVKLLFTSIGDFIEGLLSLFEGKQNTSLPESYVDTDVDIDCVIQYREYKIKEELTRHSFEAVLEAKSTLEEKYAYAYSVYTKLMRGHKYGIKPSDTPRVLTAKLSAARKNELEKATPVFEDIRYRVVRPDKTVCESQLTRLVDMVKQIL